MCNQGVQSDGMCPCGNLKIENKAPLTEYLYCQSCKKFQRFHNKSCTRCGAPFGPLAGSEAESNLSSDSLNRKISQLTIDVNSSTFLSKFFITTANVVVVLGFFIGLLSGYNATHTSYMGQTYAVPNAFFGFLVEFLIVFFAACLGAAMLAFFGHVLRALNTLTEKQNNS
jgi:hypothetical protein